jgi:hypothetical protein
MDQPQTPDTPLWPEPFSPHDWEQTPSAVQAYLRTLHDELTQCKTPRDTLEARLAQTSQTAHRPPSSDSPSTKGRPRAASPTSRKAGGKPGHQGYGQVLVPAPTVQTLTPAQCAGGNRQFAQTTP